MARRDTAILLSTVLFHLSKYLLFTKFRYTCYYPKTYLFSQLKLISL